MPGAVAIRLEFDRRCSTEKRNDPLTILDCRGRVVATRSGRDWAYWSREIRVPGDELSWKFISDSSVNGWGWKFTAYAIMPGISQEFSSDRSILSRPSMELVMCLLESRLVRIPAGALFARLVNALTACVQIHALRKFIYIYALNFCDIKCMIFR